MINQVAIHVLILKVVALTCVVVIIAMVVEFFFLLMEYFSGKI